MTQWILKSDRRTVAKFTDHRSSFSWKITAECILTSGNISAWSFPSPSSVVGVGHLPPIVRLSVFFRTISQKPIQLGSPNLTQICSTMSPVNPFILRSRGQRSRSRVTKNCRPGPLHSCECWLFVVRVQRPTTAMFFCDS